MTEEMKPCPFCAEKPHISAATGMLTCSNLGCPADYIYCFPEDWSHRPVENALRERVKRLEEALEFIEFASNAVNTVYDGKPVPHKWQQMMKKELGYLGDTARKALEEKP